MNPNIETDSRATPAGESAASNGLLARNVVANWIWYGVVIVSGFLLPRMIDDKLGKEMLGVWDLGWSVVVYVRWLQLGVSSSVNRYVARYKTTADWTGMNRMVNTSLALLSAACLLGFVGAGVLAWLIPRLLPGASADAVRVARTVVFMFCVSTSVQLPGSVYNAIITGYERFDLLNTIRIARDVIVLVIEVSLVIGGYGIVAIACVELAGDIVGGAAKLIVSKRLCPTLRIAPWQASWAETKTLYVYGGKTIAQGLARGSIYQVNGLLVTWYLGPMALAVFSRQRALVVHAVRFMKQYAQVFISTSSSLDAGGDVAGLRRLLVSSSRVGLYFTLPAMVVLLLSGDPLMHVWMGGGYEVPKVLAILTAGHILFVPLQSAFSILMGMDRHGRAAMYDVIGFVTSVVLGVLLMGPLKLGLDGAAIAIAFPTMLFSGIIMPIWACRLLELRPWTFFRDITIGPAVASLPMAACVLIAQFMFAGDPVRQLAIGVGVGGLLTSIVYLQWVIPASIRTQAIAAISRRVRRITGGLRLAEAVAERE